VIIGDVRRENEKKGFRNILGDRFMLTDTVEIHFCFSFQNNPFAHEDIIAKRPSAPMIVPNHIAVNFIV
jgi:hypothetical protein